jgi:hypothetical protein
MDSFHVERQKYGHPPNSSSIKKSSVSQSSDSIESSSIQALYRWRALVIAFGSMASFGGIEDNRSRKHVNDQVALCVTYQR